MMVGWRPWSASPTPRPRPDPEAWSPTPDQEESQMRGVDQVIEVGGGTLEKSIQATRVEGLVNFIGRLDRASTIDVGVFYRSIATLRVVAAGSRAQFVAMNRA